MCGCVNPTDAIHAVGEALSVPMDSGVLGNLLVTEIRTLSPSTASMVGPGVWPL